MFCILAEIPYICTLHCNRNDFGTPPERFHGANINISIDITINKSIDLITINNKTIDYDRRTTQT